MPVNLGIFEKLPHKFRVLRKESEKVMNTLKKPHVPLYKELSDELKSGILAGRLLPGTKLPSKRAMAEEKRLSVITVSGAYELLISEGFVESFERRGYFVAKELPVRSPPDTRQSPAITQKPKQNVRYDFTSSSVTEGFPFYTWAKLVRLTLSEKDVKLLAPIDTKGVFELRAEISKHLAAFRGIVCSPEQIIIGAGSEYLVGLIYQLLGKGNCAVEDPGFMKPARVYAGLGAGLSFIPVDKEGVSVDFMKKDPSIRIAHVTPSHSFPLGTVMSVRRRSELLRWRQSEPERFIVEDDFDSEFRYDGRCPPSLFSLSENMERENGGVVYMNTFTRTLAPSMRIGYAVLPEALAQKYERELSFYSSTVPAIEQYVLAKFMSDGSFDRHINRMRKIYRGRRDALTESLRLIKGISVLGEEAGVHLLVKLPEKLHESAVVETAASLGIALSGIENYRRSGARPHAPLFSNALVMSFAGIDEQDIRASISLLADKLAALPDA